MRHLLPALLCALCLPGWAQSGMKVPLPCESKLQSLSPGGDYAAVRCDDHSWRLIALPSGRIIRSFDSSPRLTDQSFSEDDKWFVAAFRGGMTQVIPLGSTASPRTFQAAAEIDTVRLLPGGSTVVVLPHEGPGQVWQLGPAPKLVAALPADFSGLTFVTASSDGKFVATGGSDTTVRIYDTATWKAVHEIRQFTLEPFTGAFTPDSKYLLVGGADSQITVFDPLTGKEVRKLTPTTDIVLEIDPLGDNTHAAAVQADPDGKNSEYVSIWDLEKGSSSKVRSAQPITGGGVVKGKLWLASVSERTMQIWNEDFPAAGN